MVSGVQVGVVLRAQGNDMEVQNVHRTIKDHMKTGMEHQSGRGNGGYGRGEWKSKTGL